MALDKYFLIILHTFSVFCYETSELNLNEGSPCVTQGLQGTCVNVFRCNSAALTYLLANAGFDTVQLNIPELPDICSYQDNEPVVCCTDCEIGEEKYRNTAIGPFGRLLNKEGPVARQKCFEYFQSLPFSCRSSMSFRIEKELIKDRKCHNYSLTYYGSGLAAGGRNAEKWEFPHAALLGYGDDPDSAQWLCGGSVISERFILTAAHCTSTRVLGSITYAALGLLKRSDPMKTWNIIALLETENEIAFGNDLLPACLDTGLEQKSLAVASGWGRLGHRQALADVLQVYSSEFNVQANISIEAKANIVALYSNGLNISQISNETGLYVILEEFNETECSSIYKPHRHLKQGYDHDKQMCYGSHYKLVDTCEGDSGGPLQVPESKCLYTIVGVTSYGKDCGILGSAGMYTRVSYYLPWIENIVWPEEIEERKRQYNLLLRILFSEGK